MSRRALRVAIAVVAALAGCGDSEDADVDAGPGADATVKGLAFTPASQELGLVVVGQSRLTMFQLTSTLDTAVGPLTVAALGQPGFEIMNDACTGKTLNTFQSCDFWVQATALVGGTRTTMIIATAGPVSASAQLRFTGIFDEPHLALAPATADFGNLMVGQTASREFTLANQGNDSVGPVTVTVVGSADFTVASNFCVGSLSSNGTCTVTVRLTPSTPVAKSATLNISGSGQTVSATMTGNGVGSTLALAPASISFPITPLGTSSASVTATVTNVGGIPSQALTLGLSGADATDFELDSSGTCRSGTTTLNPGTSCTVLVRFAPDSMGAKAATLTVSAGFNATATTTLSGTAEGKVYGMNLTPNLHDYGQVVVGSSSTPAVYTLTNTGGITIAMLTVALSGTNRAEFMIGPDGCSNMPLAAGAACSVTVALKPTANGTKIASLDFLTDVGTQRASGNLSGTAFTP